MSDAANEVTVTIDGIQVRVPKGMNLIEVAAKAGIEIPHYCYHPHLSIAGNCRMCQVQLEGSPKLTIACNTGASEGMVVRTQVSSPEVADAQRATLEFILINHPLDCTVCDQAGHCKLQDYYYEYNAKPSRFVEDKVHKVKAEPLGPEVVYDGERCILCTRCVRFCEEVPETGELGLYNRGDHAVIGITPGHELKNPFSGTVVDLCPVGALTHERWRFNTRVWYTDSADSICVGCSTGCNIKAHTRDGQIVHVKSRLNSAVNKEWLCDEGRYGFHRFQPENRVTTPLVFRDGKYCTVSLDEAINSAAKIALSPPGDDATAVFLSPFLTLEEVWTAIEYAKRVLKLNPASGSIAMQLRTRDLSDVEKILISPDFAPNARAASVFALLTRDGSTKDSDSWRDEIESRYVALLERVRNGAVKRILAVGDGAVLARDLDSKLCEGFCRAEISVGITSRGVPASTTTSVNSGADKIWDGAVLPAIVLLPGRTVNEKNGVMLNGAARFQRLKQLLQPPIGTFPDWMLLQKLAAASNQAILNSNVTDERALFREMVAQTGVFAGLSLLRIGDLGISLEELRNAPAPSEGVGLSSGGRA